MEIITHFIIYFMGILTGMYFVIKIEKDIKKRTKK